MLPIPAEGFALHADAIKAAAKKVRYHFPSTGISLAVAEDVVRAYLATCQSTPTASYGPAAAIRKGEA